jgi:hypothetical protein
MTTLYAHPANAQTLLACDTCDQLCKDSGIRTDEVVCETCRETRWGQCRRCCRWLPTEQLASDETGWICVACDVWNEDNDRRETR